MAHDMVDGRLVLGFIGHGPERMPQRVESKTLAAIDAQAVVELYDFLGDWIVGIFLVPAIPVSGEKDRIPVGGVLRFPSLLQNAADRLHGFRPQRSLALDSGLGAWVTQPTFFQVQVAQSKVATIGVAQSA